MSRPEPLPDPGVCPSCGSADVNAIWYGMPTSDYEDHWPANASVGGCSIMDDSPDRDCLSCGLKWMTA